MFPIARIICSLLIVLVSGINNHSLACATDVQIQEGTAISFCQGTGTTVSASAGFVSYSWTGPQNLSGATVTPTISGQYVVSAVDGVGCISTDTIDITIHPFPVGIIVSSEGNLICPGGTGTTLSLTQAFASYAWSNGSTSPGIQVNQGGTYTVDVIDFNGCSGTSAITISQPNFQLNTIGTPTVCNGSAVTLVASGGSFYSWSTGETGATIAVSPNATSTYSVTITNGTCSATLSQTITHITMPESDVADTVYVGENEVLFLNGPDGYTSYQWSPMVNLTSYTNQGANFSGSNSVTYTISASHTNGCTRNDIITVIVVKLTIPTGFSPNGDNINDTFVIPELESDLKGDLIMFNRWGDKVYEANNYQNDWNGTCQTGFCIGSGPLPEGTYFYSLDVEGVHFDGFTTIKR